MRIVNYKGYPVRMINFLDALYAYLEGEEDN